MLRSMASRRLNRSSELLWEPTVRDLSLRVVIGEVEGVQVVSEEVEVEEIEEAVRDSMAIIRDLATIKTTIIPLITSVIGMASMNSTVVVTDTNSSKIIVLNMARTMEVAIEVVSLGATAVIDIIR